MVNAEEETRLDNSYNNLWGSCVTLDIGLSQEVSNAHTPPAFWQGTAYKGQTARSVWRTPSVSSDHPENEAAISCECFLPLSRAAGTCARTHTHTYTDMSSKLLLSQLCVFLMGGVEPHALFLSTNTADQLAGFRRYATVISKRQRCHAMFWRWWPLTPLCLWHSWID